MTALVIRAHAKINLDLRILGRRADGYHDLRTIFQSLTLHDRLTVRRTRGPFAIESDDPELPRDRSNLVWRAAQAVWSAQGRAGDMHGLTVTVQKRIPDRAGLGGGSSDAAATLVALNRLWRARLDGGDLARLAVSIGADVPFFLIGGTSLGLGRGELLYPLPDVPSMGVVLVRPAFGVSTAEAYSWYASRPACAIEHVQALAVPWYPGPLALANDLEPAVMEHHPELAGIRGALLSRGAEAALMAGSGAAIFGLFQTVELARAAAAVLSRESSEAVRIGGRPWRVIVTRLLGRAAYRRAMQQAGGPPGPA
jgi:4-diphosphocytidyl-2-C-methyl-D-erythritol kinase